MKKTMVNGFRKCTPPIIWGAARKIRKRLKRLGTENTKVYDQKWYDQVFEESPEYNCYYTDSGYYFLWCVIVDRVMRSQAKSVLDIGCGPGQVANFLHEKGLETYLGLDLSPVAIAKAKALCPDYNFIAQNVFETKALEEAGYDTVISMEFLEHVDDDLSVIERIRSGTRFFATVPDFLSESHVRCFSTNEEVIRRYSSFFDSFTVDFFDLPIKKQRFFVMEGVRK